MDGVRNSARQKIGDLSTSHICATPNLLTMRQAHFCYWNRVASNPAASHAVTAAQELQAPTLCILARQQRHLFFDSASATYEMRSP